MKKWFTEQLLRFDFHDSVCLLGGDGVGSVEVEEVLREFGRYGVGFYVVSVGHNA